MTPAGLEQYRLDRLLELRAVIDSLRPNSGQELLRDAWAEQSLRALLGRADRAPALQALLPGNPCRLNCVVRLRQ